MTSLSRYARNYGQHGFGWVRIVDAAKKTRKPGLYPNLSLDGADEYSPLYPSLPDAESSSVAEVEDEFEEVTEEPIQAVKVSDIEVSSLTLPRITYTQMDLQRN